MAIEVLEPHISSMATHLTFKCPTTNRHGECDVATDSANLANVWRKTMGLECRICGGTHQIKISEAFLDMILSRQVVVCR
jgi:hypothetical protein